MPEAPTEKVTNCPGGFSNHNFGLAFDVGLFIRDAYVPESSTYKVIGSLGKSIGLEWGGDWHTFADEPHFQLRPAWSKGMTEREFIATLRIRRENGTGVFA